MSNTIIIKEETMADITADFLKTVGWEDVLARNVHRAITDSDEMVRIAHAWQNPGTDYDQNLAFGKEMFLNNPYLSRNKDVANVSVKYLPTSMYVEMQQKKADNPQFLVAAL
jgi:hypothetical protein